MPLVTQPVAGPVACPLACPVALVTGAGRNIGREIALGLAASGHAVAVNVRTSVDEGQAVVDAITAAGGQSLLCVADVSDRAAVSTMIEHITARWGRLDVLVNNAAVRREADVAALTVQDWHDTLRVVLDGAFFCTQAALALLKVAGTCGTGTIVNIGGLTAHTGAPERVHVVTAKAGLVGMTRALAHDLARHGITVNCVSPGLIDTVRKASSASAQPKHHGSHQTLLGRRGTAQEVAAAVVYLAGPTARYITGQVLHINGGAYLGG